MANFKLFHNNPNIKTLRDFSDSYKIRINNDFTIEDFFNKNRENIFKQISPSQLIKLANQKQKTVDELTSMDIDENFVLPCPCYLFIDEKYVDYVLAVKNTNFQTQEIDFFSFANKEIKKIINQSGNKFINESISGSIIREKSGCRIIGWFKSLYYSGKSNNKSSNIDNIYDSSSNFIDLTPFITQLRTSVTESGGSFSFTISPVPVYSEDLAGSMPAGVSKYESLNKRKIEKQQLDSFFNDKENLIIKSSFSSFSYFEWLIQHNDLLFISFNDMPDLQDDELSGHSFDMIGLVDSVSVSKNSPSSTTSITVTGRDLMKLISEDSSIFFPAGTSASDGRIFDNTEATLRGGDILSTRKKGSLRENGIRQPTKALDVFMQEPNGYTIDFVIKAIVSHLANMQIVPDDLFSSWGDKRTKFSDLISKKIEK